MRGIPPLEIPQLSIINLSHNALYALLGPAMICAGMPIAIPRHCIVNPTNFDASPFARFGEKLRASPSKLEHENLLVSKGAIPNSMRASFSTIVAIVKNDLFFVLNGMAEKLENVAWHCKGLWKESIILTVAIMADPQILTTLRRKRDEIEKAIFAYRSKIEDAERDLSAVAATIRLFEINGEPQQFPAYADLSRLWKRGEIVGVCRAALEAEGPLDTRELALRVIRAKGLDDADKVLRQGVAFRIVQALSIAAKRGKIADAGKRGGVRVWR